jgi:hypothetical protein
MQKLSKNKVKDGDAYILSVFIMANVSLLMDLINTETILRENTIMKNSVVVRKHFLFL